MNPKGYIKKAINNYFRMFGKMPRNNVWSPMERGDHPELDETDELQMEDIKKYQSLLGALQWLVSIGRFDIAFAVMTMSKFRVAPRSGHMLCVQRIFAYLSRFREGAIRFRTSLPDLSTLDSPSYDWEKTIYGRVTEEIPTNII